ncbi:iron chaperone [Ohtaekwangia sp.]|uniref:iron chaperone n=1 Tax=Ohtaekwangia sp. TaxID=2066019 RepID=UPI002FDDAD30
MKKGAEKVTTVDQYMATVPETVLPAVEKLRQAIRSAAPKAEEVISYQIPAYKYNGMLVGFGVAQNHIGFYVMSKSILDSFAKEVQKYSVATGTIRFPMDEPIPVALVKKIVKARIDENAAIKASKAKK